MIQLIMGRRKKKNISRLKHSKSSVQEAIKPVKPANYDEYTLDFSRILAGSLSITAIFLAIIALDSRYPFIRAYGEFLYDNLIN